MPYLRKRDTGAVTEFLNPDSLEYQMLKAMRFQSDVSLAAPSGPGIPAGATSGGSIKSGQPMWEDIAEEDAGFPDPTGGRVLVVAVPATGLTGTETVEVSPTQTEFAGTLTDVEYVPNAPVAGQATNNRSITLQQAAVTGTTTPARTVTTLASLTWDATHSNNGNATPTPLTIAQAAFTSAEPEELSVVSAPAGTGLADPGGVLYAVYTRA